MSIRRILRLASVAWAPLVWSCSRESMERLPGRTVVVPEEEGGFEPSWSPDGNTLAYATIVEGRSGIWLRDRNGANPRRLTHGVWDSAPIWSPDGTQIAYLAESPNFDVMVVAAAGGEPRQLTTSPALEVPIAWLPDGSGVIYITQGDSRDTHVVSLADGSTRRLVDVDGSVEAQFSPDGGKIAYELGLPDGKVTVWVWDAATKAHRQLTFEGREGLDEGLAWSPDGRFLLYRSHQTGNPDLWVADVTSGELRQLTTDVRPDINGRWSPDGRWVAFLSYRGGQWDIWIVPSAGGDAIRVTDDRASEEPGFRWTPDGQGITFVLDSAASRIELVPAEGGESRLLSFADYSAMAPRASPDGGTVLFTSDRSGNIDIWSVPTAGGAPRRLTPNSLEDDSPSWSPDGKSIAFASRRGPNADIVVMPDTGGEGRPLVDWPETHETLPLYAPVGRLIAFASNRDARTSDVWIVADTGGEPRRLTRFDAFTAIQDWSPDGKFILVRTGSTVGNLYRVPVAGGAPQRLDLPSGTVMVKWSPDGTTLAFSDVSGGYAHLSLAPATGGTVTRLTTAEKTYAIEPDWSPDGRSIAWSGLDFAVPTGNAHDVMVADVAARSVRKVTSTARAGEGEPSWLPDGRSILMVREHLGRPFITVNVQPLLAAPPGSPAGQK